jgi:iron(III) transport system substrate-binding protein
MADLYPWAQRFAWVSGYRSVGIYSGILGFAYNNEEWKKTGLPAPQCWADLMQPAVRGRIQMASPRTSGTAYTFLTTQLQLKGEQEGWAWLKSFHSQVGVYTRSGSAPVQALLKGEALVGIVFLHDAVSGSQAATEAGAPPKLTAVAPCEGTGYEIGSMSLIRGAPNLAGGKKFYELALSPKVQQLAVEIGAFQTQAHKQVSIPPGVPQLGNTKLINHKILTYGDPEMRKYVIDTWVKETGTPAPLPRPTAGGR